VQKKTLQFPLNLRFERKTKQQRRKKQRFLLNLGFDQKQFGGRVYIKVELGGIGQQLFLQFPTIQEF
jgi:hypothetical protein